MLWLAIFLTALASTSSSVGKVLQKQGTTHLPRLTADRRVLRQYLTSRTWLVGVAADVLGGVIQVAAFAMAPVSVVQPVSGLGLVGLSLYSHIATHERMTAWDWGAVALAGGGTLALGASSGGGGGAAPPSPARAVAVLGLLILTLAVSLHPGLRQRPKAATGAAPHHHHHQSAPTAAAGGRGTVAALRRIPPPGGAARLGLQAGACFGLSGASCRAGFTYAAAGWPLAAALGLGCSVALSSTGFALQARGLRDGATVVVCTAAAVTAMASGVVVGLAALGEELPEGRGARALCLTAWLAVASGVAALSAGERGAAVAVVRFGAQWPAAVPAATRRWALRRCAALPETSSSPALAGPVGGSAHAVTTPALPPHPRPE